MKIECANFEFSPHDISSQDTFSLHPDPNHNPSPYPIPKPYPNPNPHPNPHPNTNPDPNCNSAEAVTCLKIKGYEMNCLEMNYLVP